MTKIDKTGSSSASVPKERGASARINKSRSEKRRALLVAREPNTHASVKSENEKRYSSLQLADKKPSYGRPETFI
ncbi:protein of unknown function [Acidithiobacillus ferrivorans]|uniref:Uncharacterized protein n=1 Tax=Acidithiobacillus ferrivorans TaxID=160808 RepID=A0A060US69_9PROT|nr:hypothetical protein AFERRI_530170 [Acidithiobacillus ferrivorans]SMH67635.1 protein of unknown function [Acidithiobacillus ferrivorans]